jgi:CheY-like chemotaxis protein
MTQSMSRLVFVAEDNEPQARIMVRHWEKIGWRVERGRSVEEILEMYARHTPDVVVSDCSMPDPGQGQELARELRKRGYTGCIILVSTDVQTDTDLLLQEGIINAFYLKNNFATGDITDFLQTTSMAGS